MKTIKIPYYTSTLDLHVDEANLKAVVTAKMHDYKPAKSEVELVKDALAHPIGSKTLRELAVGKKKVTLVTSDHTRAVPSKLTLPILLAEIRAGNPDADITILIATGLHRPTTEEEQRRMFGDAIVDNEEIAVNNAFEPDDFVKVCDLPSGAEFFCNKIAVDCDLLVCEGFIEPHFFAGFSGGRKSILPGIASMKTIQQNHAHSLDPNEPHSNPAIGNAVLEGNPLHEDMCEAAAMVEQLYVVNLVMNAGMKLARITAGHWLDSWLEACKAADAMYQTSIPEKADVIITSCGGYPKDMSLYQGTKTIDNVEFGLKKGGTLVLLAECRDGGGPAEYFDWVDSLCAGTLDADLRRNFTIPGYIFYLNCEQAARYNILMLTTAPAEPLARMGIKAFTDPAELCRQLELDDRLVYVIPNGSTVIPAVK